MDFEECLRSELAAVVAIVDRVSPVIVDRRPWFLRLGSLLIAGVIL